MCWKCDHPEASTGEYLDLIRNTIRTYGWAVQFVESDRVPFAYTIGLHERRLPELLVTGMTPQLATRILNSVAEYLVAGGRPAAGELIAVGGEFQLAVVQVEHPDAHMNMAVSIYGPDVKALQLVWPDERGHRPWCAEFNNGRAGQPVLGVWVEPPDTPDRR